MAYLTVSEANDYFENRLHTMAWDEATDPQKATALQEATDRIDLLRFSGWPVADDQENEFPRFYCDSPDGTEEVPYQVQNATAEFAQALLDGANPDFELEQLSMNSTAYSSVRVSRVPNDSLPHIAAGIPNPTAWNYLRPFLSPAKTITLNRV